MAFVDPLTKQTMYVEGIPQATQEQKDTCRTMLLGLGAYDILDMLGLHD